MRVPTLVGLTLALLVSLGTHTPRAASCDPEGDIQFVCDLVPPAEDLLLLPGGKHVLTSGIGANGKIRLIDVQDKRVTVLFPTARPQVRLDAKTYSSCPGPITPDDYAKFSAHGFSLREGRNRIHTLYVVAHGFRESVEVFELDGRVNSPTLTWLGCVPVPEGKELNAVVALPDGGIAGTVRTHRGMTDPVVRDKVNAGLMVNGEVWEWHAGSGWKKIPGTEGRGINGLEVSADGRWYYIDEHGAKSVIRVSRGQTPVKRDVVALGVRADNIRWTPDGTLLIGGQGWASPSEASKAKHNSAGVDTTVAFVIRLNPTTLEHQAIIRYPYSEAFGVPSAAVQVGKQIWVGSAIRNRIAIFPAK